MPKTLTHKNLKPTILIGTPIHVCKDYAMERWLENVAKLEYPADLLLVDNSPDLEYVEKVKGYCAKYELRPVGIEHLEIDQGLGTDIRISDTRIEAAQEMVRQYVLSHDYDAWFSWECDQIIPTNALDELIKMMKAGDFMMVVHNSHARWDPTILNTNMGVTLIKRECLKKNWFLPKRDGKISLDPSDSYDVNDPAVFKKRVLRSGGNFIEVFGIIKPIYHLSR